MFECFEEMQGGETTTLYALAENSGIGPDKRYTVNDSSPAATTLRSN